MKIETLPKNARLRGSFGFLGRVIDGLKTWFCSSFQTFQTVLLMKNSRHFLLLFAPICLLLMSFVIQKEGGQTTVADWLAVAAGAGLTGWAGRRFWLKNRRKALASTYPDKKRLGCCGVISVIVVATGCVLLIRACS